MNQYETEKRLCWAYSLLTVLLVTTAICVAIPYNHWRQTLDVCPGNWLENTNCGCIFYGVSTFQYFNGGRDSYCLYTIFAPLPILVYALVMAVFHMYRVCINNIGKYESEKSTTVEEIEGESIIVTSRARVPAQSDGVIFCWIPNACLAAVFAIYNLVHAAIMTDGFFKTCTQYRGYLVRQLHATGDHATTIHFRLSCQSIFDFMDYIQKDAPNSRRGNFINTGIALQIALITTWFAVFLWIVVAVHTALRAYKERAVLTCCGK
ncbi:uncharacterized protein LOC123864813 [Maniola jurtina]|uniref:uncharacterized protein LOC123864813 n=1 Tax=Maniola jurtina TaxID=191418 RepID=UPI001E68CA94|nr:uncharacterized protein LOC123864813 [Maniola jurtina]XP_045761470.1 uncharacterized protein LOC123864813 [Maniola jurtina]XP_045761471.1 uncharacterized protein LOC123864813 [Maniola jurtina]